MEKLDEIVVGEVARQVLDPDRLTAMLDAYVQSAAAQADGAKAQLAKLRHDHSAAVAGIVRLLELVEKGLMEAEDPHSPKNLVRSNRVNGRSSDIWRDRHETLSLHSPSWFGHMPYFAYPEGWPLHRRRTSLPIGSTPIGLAVIWRRSSRSSHRAPA
jgi:hypothetical protein